MESSDLFLSIPSTPFLLVMCPFLRPSDILNLRLTCRRTHELLHREHESEELWKILLRQNFGIKGDFRKTLEIAPLSETATTSIFGVHPTGGAAIKEASSCFESWKHWIRCARRFHSGPPETDRTLKDIDRERFLHGPYFLRAAALWGTILAWLETPELSGDVGSRVKASLSRGMFHLGWSSLREEDGLQACQAVYAFCGGHEAFRIMSEDNFERFFDGLLGGYHAYNFYSCTHLIRPRALPSEKIMIATDAFAVSSGLRKAFCVDCQTGMVELHYGQNQVRPVVNGTDVLGLDAVLLWLEEFAGRLSTCQIGVGPMGSTPHDYKAILLYPRLPAGASPRVTQGIQNVSRAVTRGVEVVASSVYLPQTNHRNLGFVYNIRIRLLTPRDEDYVSATERGFETCQLVSRHWRIRDHETDRVDQVDGDGVVGLYPLLREGGYTEGRDYFEGVFSYTSCTAPMRGSFSGHLRFVPGFLRSPTGPAFDAELRPFALDNNPSFLY